MFMLNDLYLCLCVCVVCVCVCVIGHAAMIYNIFYTIL